MELKPKESVNYLTLNIDNATVFNEKVQLIKIECKSFENFKEQLSTINLDCFPNCIVIQSDCELTLRKVVEELNNISYLNYFKTRPFLIDFQKGKFFKQRDDVFKIARNTGIECIEKFCNKVKNICDLNFEKLNDLFGNDFRKLIIDSIETHDELCFKILHIFDHPKYQEDIYKNILKSRNFELVKFYRKFNEAINLTEDEFHNCYAEAWKKVKNIFESAISANEEKVINFLLNFFQEKYYLNINEKHNNEDDNIKIRTEAIERIYIKDLESAKLFVEKNPQHEFCKSDLSPLDTAISLQIYEAIALLHFKSKNKNEHLKKIQSLCKHAKKKVFNEIVKLMDYLPNLYIELIITKLFRFDDETESESELIKSEYQKMLNHLDKIEDIRPLLKIAALMDIKLIIESQNDSTERVNFNNYNLTENATAGQKEKVEKGVTYHKENLIIIAKDLKNLNNIKELYGTFTHEIFHQILFCMYENDAKPFCKEDKDRKEQWEILRCALQKNAKSQVEIVELALKCGAGVDKELAVRYVHLVAQNHPNLAELERNDGFNMLRKFHREHVLKDMNENLYRTIKLNNHFGVINKIINSKLEIEKSNEIFDAIKEKKNFYIISNVPFLALLQLYKEVANRLSDDRRPKIELNGKNIFVNFQSLCKFDNKSKLEELLKRCQKCVSRIIITFDADEHSYHSSTLEQVLDFLNDIHVQIVLITSCESYRIFSKTISPKRVNVDFTWQKLMQSTKDVISKITITFRNNLKYTMKEIFSLQSNSSSSNEWIIPSDALNFIFNSDDPKIDPAEPKLLDFNFIPRKLYENLKTLVPISLESLTMDKLLETTKDKNIVVISDFPGSGKTSILHAIHSKLHREYANYWICFVSLREYKEALNSESESPNDFVQGVSDKIFRFNEIERKLFELKYKANEVVILFDGLDEIFPDCKHFMTRLIKLHSNEGKSQIWIATRTHLENYMKSLKIDLYIFKLFTLTDIEQTDYLCNYWADNRKTFELSREKAEKIVKKFSKMIRSNYLGTIMQLQMLCLYLINNLTNETSIENLHENLEISEVYKFSIRNYIKLKGKDPNDTLAYEEKYYEALALTFVLKNERNFFGSFVHAAAIPYFERQDELFKLVSRNGIIVHDKKNRAFFNHTTHGEFYVSQFIYDYLKDFENVKKFEVNDENRDKFFKFLSRALKDPEFGIIRMFLNNFCAKLLKLPKRNEMKEIGRYIAILLDDNLKCVIIPAQEELENLIFFILQCMKCQNKNFDFLFSQYIKKTVIKNHIHPINEGSVLMNVLPKIKSSEIFAYILNEAFPDDKSDRSFYELLMIKNHENFTIFHQMLKSESFKVFWSKVEKKLSYDEKMEVLANETKTSTKCLLHYACKEDSICDDNIYMMIEIIKSMKKSDQKNLYEMTLERGDNEVFNKYPFVVSEYEKLKQDKDFNCNNGQNYRAIENLSNVERKINDIIKSILNKQNFFHIFDVNASFIRNEDKKELLFNIVAGGDVKMLMHFLEHFNDKNLPKEEHEAHNIFHFAAKTNRQLLESLLDELIERKFLTREELKKMLRKEHRGNTPLHYFCLNDIKKEDLKCLRSFVAHYKDLSEYEDILRKECLSSNKSIKSWISDHKEKQELMQIFKQ